MERGAGMKRGDEAQNRLEDMPNGRIPQRESTYPSGVDIITAAKTDVSCEAK